MSSTFDKRPRRSRAQILQLEAQIFNVLYEGVRHVFYCMTDPRLPEPVEKTDRGYAQVQHRITEMRRAGKLPYGWIIDATRRGYHVETYDGPADFIRETASLYRRNLWRQADRYVEVWTESRSLAGVVEDTCRDLASLYPAGGVSSITLAHQAAAHIAWATHKGAVPAEIVYIGDYESAGVLIDRSIEAELRTHLSGSVLLIFHPLAITQDQIAHYGLATKPASRRTSVPSISPKP